MTIFPLISVEQNGLGERHVESSNSKALFKEQNYDGVVMRILIGSLNPSVILQLRSPEGFAENFSINEKCNERLRKIAGQSVLFKMDISTPGSHESNKLCNFDKE
uniref:Uncharacterized protein n=1 Tax=Vespula pensylvanica TaxID=30213 RepID=A0A834NYN9_VESPE|nr:hypothetical protein H0235_009538 [Vespula pensylvanica]